MDNADGSKIVSINKTGILLENGASSATVRTHEVSNEIMNTKAVITAQSNNQTDLSLPCSNLISKTLEPNQNACTPSNNISGKSNLGALGICNSVLRGNELALKEASIPIEDSNFQAHLISEARNETRTYFDGLFNK